MRSIRISIAIGAMVSVVHRVQVVSALLLAPHYPSKRRRGSALLSLHRPQSSKLNDGNYYVDDDTDANVRNNNHRGEMDRHHARQTEPSNAFIANDYEFGSANRNKVIGRRNNDRDNGKNNSRHVGIADVFSRVFHPKSHHGHENHQSNDNNSNSRPSIAETRISLPDLQDPSDENVRKLLTSDAILSGGKFVTSLLGEAILRTAKFAVNTLGNNHDNNNTTATTLLETSPYNDVCDFDDELCREIEDALAATESFKRLNEKSETTQNVMFDRERHHGVGNRGNGVQYDVNTSFDNDYTNTRTHQPNKVAKSNNDSHFASSTRENSFQEYYQRSLEEQLLVQRQHSKMSRRNNEKPKVLKEPSHKHFNEGNARTPIEVKQPVIDTRALLDTNRREMTNEHSKWRDGRSYNSNGYSTMKHPTWHKQPQYVERAEMKKPQMPQQPSSKHYESYIESTKTKHQQQPNNRGDTIEGHVGLDLNNVGRSVSNRSERSRWSGDRSYTDRSDHVKNNPREKFDFPHEENATNDANVTPRRQHMSNFARENQTTRASKSGENTTPVKLDITDEALAFARSLNLDVYEIYLSTQIRDSNHIVTLEKVVQYYERMRIGPWRYQFSTHETRTSAQPKVSREAILEPPTSTGGERRRRNTDNFEGRQLQQTQSAYRANLERRANERVPRFKPRNYDQQSRVQNNVTQGTDYRPPRFRKYPTAHHASPSPLPPAYSDRYNLHSKKSHHASNENRSSMSNFRDSRQKSRLSISLAELIQGPGERGMEQVPTNTFREPYQEGREIKSRTSKPKLTNTMNRPYQRQPSLRELSERYASSLTDTTQQEVDSTYDNPNPELS